MSRIATTETAPRRGFSLPDLLCVVALVGFALTLMIPAVARTSEAARRVQCLNNLRQIGLATTNYTGFDGRFPSGPAAVAGGGAPLSWLARLLPNLDQAAASDGLDFSQPLDAPANVGLSGLGVSVFRCPSDRGAGGSYAGARHHRDAPPAPTDTGLLRLGAPVTPAMCADGLSNTLLCGEKRDAGVFGRWAAAGTGSLRTGHAPPGSDPVAGFAGHHGGGAYFLSADGAGRWCPDAVDPAVFVRLCRFEDGEIPPSWPVMR